MEYLTEFLDRIGMSQWVDHSFTSLSYAECSCRDTSQIDLKGICRGIRGPPLHKGKRKPTLLVMQRTLCVSHIGSTVYLQRACHPGGVGMNEGQMIESGYVHSIKMFDFFQVNQVTHDQAVVLQSALQSIPNPSSECMLRNVSIRLAQQISDEVMKLLLSGRTLFEFSLHEKQKQKP